MDKKELGSVGEKIARKYLKKQGYKILDANFSNKWGEIDIVAKKDNLIAFCEVKTIKERTGFSPEDQVDWQKKKQLKKMAEIYLTGHKISFETPWQIDILAITVSPDLKQNNVQHFENALEDI